MIGVIMDNKFKIRNAKEEDYSAINELYYQTYCLCHENLPEEYKVQPKANLPKGTFLNMTEDKDSKVLVIEVNNNFAGFIYAEIEVQEEDEYCHGYRRARIEEIGIKNEYLRSGLGTYLVAEIENWAKELKLESIRALTYDFNKQSINFFTSQNFAPYSIEYEKRIKND